MTIKKNYSFSIILCTYEPNEVFFQEQIESIINQTYKNWKLFIFDDSKSKKCKLLIDKLKIKNIIFYFKGPHRTFSHNFLNGLKNKSVKNDLYVFADQDDIWFDSKLEYINKFFNTVDNSAPVLYCGRTIYVNSNNSKLLNLSPLFNKKPSLKNALVQSLAGGNTMCMNNSLRDRVNQFEDVDIFSHDWWFYIVNELSSGTTYYDESPLILYRQHNNSLIGGNVGFMPQIRRLALVLNGTYKLWNDKHWKTLNKNRKIISPDKICVLEEFNHIRSCFFPINYFFLNKYKFYRQRIIGHLGIIIALIFSKF